LYRIEEGAVGVEEPVLNQQRDLVPPPGQVETFFALVTDEIKARQPGEDI